MCPGFGECATDEEAYPGCREGFSLNFSCIAFYEVAREAESGGIMLVDGKVGSLSTCLERRDVSRRREQDRRSTVDRGVQQPRHAGRSGRPCSRLRRSCPGLPGPLDSEAWTQFIASFAEAFPDLRLTVEDILSEGDVVAARIAFHGTHRGEFQGIPPTNKQVAFSGIEIDRMVDGKVQEHWFELDQLGLMRQLGALPEPEQSEEASPA
jgi:predicted ester cyclase